jgi:PAS domain S-box-containing protein
MQLSSQQEIQILHVDDDPSITDLTGTFLEREDDRFAVETATSADEGLEKLRDGALDCVVSDYNMPGMDGLEFLRAVREEYPDLPFILFTGKGSETVASDAIAGGVTDYLQKASGSEQYELLANRIRNAVEARRETRRADRQEQLMRLTEFAGGTGGFELDMNSGDLLFTDGTRRLVGLPDDTHMTLEEGIKLYHPDDQADVRQTVTRAAETGEETRGTWRLQTLDGDERLVNVTMVPATDNGDVTTLRGAVHDVTERRKRRQELEQTETLFQHAQDSLFLISVAEEFTLERVNPAYEKATGLSADRLQGRTPQEILDEQQGATIERRYRDCVERREPLEYTEQLRFDGDQMQWETQIAPVVLDGSVEYIVGATRDVTDRKERERELSRLQQAIDNANVPITLADPSQEDDPLVYVNDGFEEMTGYPPEETLGRNCRFLQGEDTDSEKVATLRDAIDNEETISVELRNYRKDGTEFWNRLTVTPIYGDDDGLVRYLGTQQDVTERKERERELTQTRDLMSNMEQLASTGAWEYDQESETLTLTEGVRRVHGIESGADLSLEAAFETFHPDDRDLLQDRFNTCLETGEPYEMDARLTTPDGQQRWITIRAERITDGENNSVVRGYVQDITETKERKRKLDLVERLFEYTEEYQFIVEVADGEFKLRHANQYYKQTVGPAVTAPVTGQTPGELFGETAGQQVREQYRRCVETQDSISYTTELPVPNEGTIYRSILTPVVTNGEVTHIVGTARDITERVERQRDLEEYRTIVEALADGVYVTDEEGQFTHVNDEFVELVGYDRETIIGNTPSLIKDDDSVEEAEHQLGRLLSSDGPDTVNFEVTIQPRTSDPLTCEDHMCVLPYDDEEFEGSVGVLRDITERKERERELQNITSQYEALIDNFPGGGVFLLDEDMRFVRAGGDNLAEIGLTSADFEGNTPHDLYPGQTADEQVHYLQRTFDGENHTYRQEFQGAHYELRTMPIRDDTGEVIYAMAVSRDITQQVEQEREVQSQNERLEEFASIVSHDLRNPLGVAEGYLELAQETSESEHITKARDAIERSQALIEDLLTLAQQGNRVDETSPVTLDSVAEECWETVETAAATLTVEAPQSIEADRSRLKQLFENVYRNAVEHGGDDVTVAVGAMDDGFYMADTGTGIPESEREDVFEAGYSTNEDGTGFGLRIVEQIAEAHGWEITVTESEQGGVRFEFTGVERVE